MLVLIMTGQDNVCETIPKHFTQITDNYSVRRDKLKKMLM